MPDGSGHVNSGSQNRYNRIGKITDSKKRIRRFDKGERITGQHHKDPPCWTGGTPVTWKEKVPPDIPREIPPTELSVTTSKIWDLRSGVEIDMLTTFRDQPAQIVEYHPLVQFFNQVMAGIVADGWLEALGNLDRKDIAEKFWEYIDTKYILHSDAAEVKALSEGFKIFMKKLGLPPTDWDNLTGGKGEG